MAPQAGWSLPTTVYYDSGRASGAIPHKGALAFRVDSQLMELVLSPAYAPRTKVFGGQAAFSLSLGAGSNATSVDLSGSPGSAELKRSQTICGATDISPLTSLAWNNGVDNWMAYLTGNIPTGSYSSTRLSDIGIGHAAIDTGGGYTYFNSQTGRGLSAVVGFT